jgi:hypothetical protein
MTSEHKTEEARLLRELLAEAHSRIRELRFQADQLGREVLSIRLSDRRGAVVSHTRTERERRVNSVRIAELDVDRPGHGRHSGLS